MSAEQLWHPKLGSIEYIGFSPDILSVLSSFNMCAFAACLSSSHKHTHRHVLHMCTASKICGGVVEKFRGKTKTEQRTRRRKQSVDQVRQEMSAEDGEGSVLGKSSA